MALQQALQPSEFGASIPVRREDGSPVNFLRFPWFAKGRKLAPSLPSKITEHCSFRIRATATPPVTQPLVNSHANIPVLTVNEVYGQLAGRRHGNMSTYKAFYSSVVGGITKDKAGMVIPMDDHMVHRGHGVFDTAIVWEGHMYELDAHLDRLLASASKAKLVPLFSRNELRDIVLETAAVSGVAKGYMRYWLSAGPGGFTLSLKECEQAAFYVMAIEGKKVGEPTNGVKVITSTVPIKPPQFATQKSVNYLPNALVLWEAEQAGAAAGIWLDQDGFIGEGQSMNCAFVSREGVLLVPEFDSILAGCTMKRVMKLSQSLIRGEPSNGTVKLSVAGEESGEVGLVDVRMGKISVEEARHAREMMLCGSGVMVEPVVQWDEQVIGSGQPGAVTLALRKLLEEDLMFGGEYQRIPVIYR